MTGRLYLVGFMGAGKTTLGVQLALEARVPFLDSDTMIEQASGNKVADLFRQHGEAYFRRLEQMVLYATAFLDTAVIATGGGMAAFERNMDWMRAHGTTVYLKAGAQTLQSRLLRDRRERPLLHGVPEANFNLFISQKLSERSVFYESAHHTIPSDQLEYALEALRALVGAADGTLRIPGLP